MAQKINKKLHNKMANNIVDFEINETDGVYEFYCETENGGISKIDPSFVLIDFEINETDGVYEFYFQTPNGIEVKHFKR